MKASDFIANFDSASAMLRALGAYLHGKDFSGLGSSPSVKPLARAVNAIPKAGRQLIYTWSGWQEAISSEKLADVRAEEASRWMVRQYPERQYPAVLIGSSNGAAVHLAAALGVPWLPQTFLIPVRRTGIHEDEMVADMEWGRDPGRALLDANPELQLHHMHDPNQDRLMIQRMTYFRVKRIRLGETFERFLRQRLMPGGTIFMVECELKWPTVQVGERHFFQPGASGGLMPDEYLHGSERVVDLLTRYDSHRRSWDPPAPDGERPEAEWGFEPALGDDVTGLAQERGYHVRRTVFEQPEDLSPLVADLYRWWYGQRQLSPNRLLVESFIAMEPWWALRTGSVPYWAKFAVEPSAEKLEEYLNSVNPYDEINIMLFSHGTESAGLAPVARWRSILERASTRGRLIGVDEEKFPRDFGSFIRYHEELKEIQARYPIPGPLALSQLDVFLAEAGERYPIRWIDHVSGNPYSAAGMQE